MEIIFGLTPEVGNSENVVTITFDGVKATNPDIGGVQFAVVVEALTIEGDTNFIVRHVTPVI